MMLRNDWRDVLRKAWSVRWILVAGLLSGAEVAIALAQPFLEPQLPRGTFSALAGAATAAALIARLLVQPDITPKEAQVNVDQ